MVLPRFESAMTVLSKSQTVSGALSISGLVRGALSALSVRAIPAQIGPLTPELPRFVVITGVLGGAGAGDP